MMNKNSGQAAVILVVMIFLILLSLLTLPLETEFKVKAQVQAETVSIEENRIREIPLLQVFPPSDQVTSGDKTIVLRIKKGDEKIAQTHKSNLGEGTVWLRTRIRDFEEGTTLHVNVSLYEGEIFQDTDPIDVREFNIEV